MNDDARHKHEQIAVGNLGRFAYFGHCPKKEAVACDAHEPQRKAKRKLDKNAVAALGTLLGKHALAAL